MKRILFVLILINGFCIQPGKADIVEIMEDSLYLSSVNEARNLDDLKKVGITHIVNLTGYKNNDLKELRFPNPFPNDYIDGRNYLHIKISDEMDTNIQEYFSDINRKFIHPAIKSHGKVLVHCEAGISRSSSVVIAYLMQAQNMDLKAAYELVKAKKPNIAPNKQFMVQLMNFEKRLTRKAIPTLNLTEYLTDQIFEITGGIHPKDQIQELLVNNDNEPNSVIQILFN